MYWALLPFKRYADFNGRSRRLEYWMFTLLQVIVFALLQAVTGFAFVFGADELNEANFANLAVIIVVFCIYALAVFIPSVAVQVRRFHDQDKSGWHILLGFIPIIGGLIVLIFMCLEGTRGENRYGPDPKYPEDMDDVFA